MTGAFVSRLKQHMGDSEVHGVKYILSPSSSTLRRITYLLAVSSCFFFSIHLLLTRFAFFLQFHVASSSTVTRAATVDYPEVTVCAPAWNFLEHGRLEPLDILRSPSSEKGRLFLKRAAFDDDDDDRLSEEFIRFGQLLLDNPDAARVNDSLDVFFTKWTANEIRLFYSQKWYGRRIRTLVEFGDQEIIGDFNLTEMILRAGFRTEEYIQSCDIWTMGGSEPIDCKSRITRHVADVGLCYTLPPVEFQVVGTFGFQLRLNLANSYGVDFDQVPGESANMFYPTFSIDSPDSTYITRGQKSSINLRPGDNWYFQLTKTSVIHRLGPPYGEKCGTDQDLIYNTGHYSVSRCWMECISRAMMNNDTIACRLPEAEGVPGPHCSYLILPRHLWSWFNELMSTECNTRCPVPCREKFFAYNMVDASRDGDRQPQAPIELNFNLQEGIESVDIEEHARYDLSTFATEIGGACSLFLGLSALSLIHLIEFTVKEIIRFFRTPISRSRDENVVTVLNSDKNIAGE